MRSHQHRIAFVLPIDLEAFRRSEIGCADGPETLLGLAAALSASPIWGDMSEATIVVRPKPQPILGIIGFFDAEEIARVETLSWQLDYAMAGLRYVSYAQGEEDVAHLAARLVECFGRDELRSFAFAAIPRGGLIVLGMLAYVLGLKETQLQRPQPPDLPLVVVDDCALSGVRFGRFLEHCKSREVIFAHLYSHPDLRAAIEARESKVRRCISARDLHDHAPERLGAEYSEWRQRWLARSEPGYWVGQPDHVCFAWNEPDIVVWNPSTERAEPGWRLVPPQWCLKNRPSLDAEPLRVHVQAEAPGPLKPSECALFGEVGERVVLANIETSASVALDGVAADMWRAIVENGHLEGAIRTLLEDYAIDEDTLRADLEKFVGELLSLRLLEESDVVDA